jgi:hypothetical protein
MSRRSPRPKQSPTRSSDCSAPGSRCARCRPRCRARPSAASRSSARFTSASRLKTADLPYLVYLRDPTTGGVMAMTRSTRSTTPWRPAPRVGGVVGRHDPQLLRRVDRGSVVGGVRAALAGLFVVTMIALSAVLAWYESIRQPTTTDLLPTSMATIGIMPIVCIRTPNSSPPAKPPTTPLTNRPTIASRTR